MLETFKTPNLSIHVTEDRELARTHYYSKIISIIEQLSQQGAIYKISGHCVATCDLLQHLLYDQGIASRILEVQVTISKTQRDQLPRFNFIGYDSMQGRGEIDTHMVVITDTDIPVLIDISIVDQLTVEHPLIVERAREHGGDCVGDYRWPNLHVTYKIKKTPRFPQLNNQNLVSRMIKDQQLRRNIRWLNIMVAVALTVSSLNALRGAYDFYMVYVAENNWGPRSLERLHEKLQRLEQQQ